MSKVILDAIKANPNISAEKLKKILDEEKNKKDFNIDLEDNQGCRALFYLIQAENIDAIKLLVSPSINASLIVKPKGELGKTLALNFMNRKNKALLDLLFYPEVSKNEIEEFLLVPNITARFFELHKKILVIANLFLSCTEQKKFNKSNLEVLAKIVNKLSILNDELEKIIAKLNILDYKNFYCLYYNAHQTLLDSLIAFEFFKEIIDFFNSKKKKKIEFIQSREFFKKIYTIKDQSKKTAFIPVFTSIIKKFLTQLLEKYFEDNGFLSSLLLISIAFLNCQLDCAENVKFYDLVAKLCLRIGLYDEAEELFKKILLLKREGKNIHSYLGISLTYFSLGICECILSKPEISKKNQLKLIKEDASLQRQALFSDMYMEPFTMGNTQLEAVFMSHFVFGDGFVNELQDLSKACFSNMQEYLEQYAASTQLVEREEFRKIINAYQKVLLILIKQLENAYQSLTKETDDLKQISLGLLDKVDFVLNNLNYLYEALITIIDFYFSILQSADYNLLQQLNDYRKAKFENESNKQQHEKKYGVYGRRKIDVLERILDIEKTETKKNKGKKIKKQKALQAQPAVIIETTQPEKKLLTTLPDKENIHNSSTVKYENSANTNQVKHNRHFGFFIDSKLNDYLPANKINQTVKVEQAIDTEVTTVETVIQQSETIAPMYGAPADISVYPETPKRLSIDITLFEKEIVENFTAGINKLSLDNFAFARNNFRDALNGYKLIGKTRRIIDCYYYLILLEKKFYSNIENIKEKLDGFTLVLDLCNEIIKNYKDKAEYSVYAEVCEIRIFILEQLEQLNKQYRTSKIGLVK